VLLGSLALVVAIMLAAPLHMNLRRRQPASSSRIPLRHRVVAADRRDRLLVEPISGMTVAHAAADLPACSVRRLDRARLLRHGAVGWRDRLHRASNGGTTSPGSQDRFPRRRDAAKSADRHSSSARSLGAGPRSVSASANDAATVYVPRIAKQSLKPATAAGRCAMSRPFRRRCASIRRR
jgi:hypothetical protein